MPEWADKAIGDIVAVSRSRNASLGVTGALLFARGKFAQFLEGSEDAVTMLRDSIERDPRHGRIDTIAAGPAPSRRFADWSLAYAGGSQFVAGEIDKPLDDATGSPNRLITLLEEFSRDGARSDQ